MKIEHKAIGFDNEALREYAQQLAIQFNLELSNEILPRLQVTIDKVVLLSDNFSPMWVDFTGDLIKKRHGAGKKQGLVRACKPAPGVSVLDLTAGWGRDAAILASFGADVLMLERQPIMATLLTDGLQRLTQHSITSQLDLVYTDAFSYLNRLNVFLNQSVTSYTSKTNHEIYPHPDIIYIDPMHPLRQKAALVKKDMQILQCLFGADDDVVELIYLALKCAKSRVVVKWPQRLASLMKPNLSVEGKTIKFDVFFAKSSIHC